MVKSSLSYNPTIGVHPGESLKDELEFLKVSQVELAQRTGISEKHISQIINGESPITPETAIKFERAINGSADFWNTLQKNYDATVARIGAEERLEKEIIEAKKYTCYAELVACGYVEKAITGRARAGKLLNFFGVDSLAYVPKLESIALRQGKGTFDKYSLAAWLRCGELDAKKITVKAFNEKVIRDSLPELRKLTLSPKGFGEKLQAICAEAGVAVVFTPYFPRTRVNGATRWSGDTPIIQLNTRGAYGDIFWFTFFHEIGHILYHGVKDRFIEYTGLNKDEKEKEADRFAQEALIPKDQYKKFLEPATITGKSVEVFAKSIGIDSSIVFGRLAHEDIAGWNQIASHRSRLIIAP